MPESNLITFSERLREARSSPQPLVNNDTELLDLADEAHPQRKKPWYWLMSTIQNVAKTSCRSDRQIDEEDLRTKNRKCTCRTFGIIFLCIVALGSSIAVIHLITDAFHELGYVSRSTHDLEQTEVDQWNANYEEQQFSSYNDHALSDKDVSDFTDDHTNIDGYLDHPNQEHEDETRDYHSYPYKESPNNNYDNLRMHNQEERDNSSEYRDYFPVYDINPYPWPINQENKGDDSDHKNISPMYDESRNSDDYLTMKLEINNERSEHDDYPPLNENNRNIGDHLKMKSHSIQDSSDNHDGPPQYEVTDDFLRMRNQENKIESSDYSQYSHEYEDSRNIDDYLEMGNQESEDEILNTRDYLHQHDDTGDKYLPKYLSKTDKDALIPVDTLAEGDDEYDGEDYDKDNNEGYEIERQTNSTLPNYDQIIYDNIEELYSDMSDSEANKTNNEDKTTPGENDMDNWYTDYLDLPHDKTNTTIPSLIVQPDDYYYLRDYEPTSRDEDGDVGLSLNDPEDNFDHKSTYDDLYDSNKTNAKQFFSGVQDLDNDYQMQGDRHILTKTNGTFDDQTKEKTGEIHDYNGDEKSVTVHDTIGNNAAGTIFKNDLSGIPNERFNYRYDVYSDGNNELNVGEKNVMNNEESISDYPADQNVRQSQ